MKKQTYIIFVLSLIIALGLGSCKEAKHETRALVNDINDSTMIISSKDDGQVTLDIRTATFINGAVQGGDSVEVTWEGNANNSDWTKKRAAIVNLVPRQGHHFRVGEDKSMPLKTNGHKQTKEEKKNEDEFFKNLKK